MSDESKVIGQERHLLPVPLTRDEIVERALRMAEIELDLVKATNEFNEAKKQHKELSERLDGERSHLATAIRARQEERPVDVELHAVYHLNVVRMIRRDTGEVWRERALAPDERQEVMPLEAPRRKRRGAEDVESA